MAMRADNSDHPSADAPAILTPAPPRMSIEPDATTQPAVARAIIYSGSIRLTVASISSTLTVIEQLASSLGGYLETLDNHSITIRVPAARFGDAVMAVTAQGEVTEKQIRSADVTEEMRDLDIRLANAEQTREQLLKLMDKSVKMEDTIKIETELERVTQEVELLKGKIRFMQQQVAYSVLKVDVNSEVPQAQIAAIVPFPWVRELGQGVARGAPPEESKHSGWFSGGVGFTLPSGFILYYQHDDTTEAMNADGVMIKATRHDNYKGGDVAFWAALAHRALVETRSVAISREIDATANGHPARIIEGSKDIPGGVQGYVLLVAASEDHVCTFEAWGPKVLIDKDQDNIEKAARSMEAR